MKKLLIVLSLAFLPALGNVASEKSDIGKTTYSDVYSFLNLSAIGLKSDIFNTALKGWEKLKGKGKLANTNIITIADYSQSSNNKRLYVIDLANKKLLFNTYVAHGKNTGLEYAKTFSNTPSSLASSLGFYVTSNTIISPKHGLALLINGVEKGYNDNALKREIIIHEADYATESFIKKHGRLGRSYGCPALPPELNKQIINTIKVGTCLFIYYPSQEYMSSSSLLN